MAFLEAQFLKLTEVINSYRVRGNLEKQTFLMIDEALDKIDYSIFAISCLVDRLTEYHVIWYTAGNWTWIYGDGFISLS